MISVKRSNLTSFFKAAYHAYPGSVKKQTESSSYTSRHMLQKFSNTSANNNGLLSTYK